MSIRNQQLNDIQHATGVKVLNSIRYSDENVVSHVQHVKSYHILREKVFFFNVSECIPCYRLGLCALNSNTRQKKPLSFQLTISVNHENDTNEFTLFVCLLITQNA